MIVGGKWSGTTTKDVLAYNINSNTYSPMEAFPQRQLIPNLVDYNGMVIYAFAGQNTQGLRTNTVYKLNLTSQIPRWETCPSLAYVTDRAVVLPLWAQASTGGP